ncbi:reverse transcriptase family protein [Alkalicoccobacillus gibsonii]|uniref:reverse transcriptase family protein n=1 Tax=Alkalicoccobacillus gibsonii TaxID=79881 RepID=UPI003F7BBFD7
MNEEDLKTNLLNKTSYYHTFDIEKKGGVRQISALRKGNNLYNLQHNLANKFLNTIPLPDNVCGFVKGKSYKDFLKPHVRSVSKERFFLRLDIKNFFNSIDTSIIDNALKEYITINDKDENSRVLEDIVNIVTLNNVLPQGGVTSPVISNIIFRRLDLRIRKYCSNFDITYTRYADDMLFSSRYEKNLNPFFIKKIYYILKSRKFELNSTKIKRTKNIISLNGFVVDTEIRISRSKKKDINNFIFLFNQGGKPKNISILIERLFGQKASDEADLIYKKELILNKLSGYRSLFIDWLPEDSDSIQGIQRRKYIEKIENTIISIENLS